MNRQCPYLCFLFAVVLAATVSAGADWRGFRGQELQGRSVASEVSLSGTDRADVLWTATVPGTGFSSPIVSDDSVCVTTAYQTTRFRFLRLALVVLSTVLGVVLCAGGAAGVALKRSAPQLTFRRLRCLAWPLFVFVLAAGIFIWSGRRFRLEEVPKRAWIISVAVVLAAQALAGLSLPLRSRAWRIIGSFLVAFSAIAFVYHPYREHLFVMSSLSVPVSLGVLFGTFAAGAGLLVMQSVLAGRADPGGPAGQTGRLPHVLIPSALLLGAVVFAEANGAMSRRELVGAVISLSLRDGSTRWVRETLPCRKRRRSVHNTPATPTAVTDGQRVVAWFASAGVVCLDMHGRVLWKNRRFRSEPKYGAVSSPVLRDGVLVLLSDVGERGRHGQSAQSWIAGLDSATGERLWQQPRRSHPEYANYATPVVDTRDGKGIVWVHGWYGLDGYDLQTGKPVGRYAYELEARHLVASPALGGDRLFIPGAEMHRCVDLSRVIAGEDPLLWARESTGEISATPVIAGGSVFLIDERGKAMCLDVETGACQWEERLPGLYWASPVASADRVCFLNEKGLMTVVASERGFAVRARHDLGEAVHASPAAVGALLVRTDQAIHCIR